MILQCCCTWCVANRVEEKNCKALLILLLKRKRRLQTQKKLGANNWNDTTDATATVPIDGNKPMGAHLKFEKKMIKWRLLGAMQRRSYLSKYMWQEQAAKKVAAQSRIKADKAKYTEVTKKQKIMWEIRHAKAPLIST